MTDSTQAAKAPAPKTVADDMDSRRVFPDVTTAIAYLTSLGDSLSDFGNFPIASPGVDSEGNFDPAIYTPDMDVMVAKLRSQKGGPLGKVKCIVVAPIPKLDSLLADETGKDWIRGIIEKELNHVAVRPLREAENISTVVDQMPTTRTAYISSGRESSGIMATFDELYKSIIATMAGSIPIFAKARLIKGELRKAFESKGYAQEYYATLEDRGEKDSLFVMALNLGINAAKKKSMDPTIFERWLATRNEKVFTPGQDDDEDDFDLDSLTESMVKAEAPAPETAPTEPTPPVESAPAAATT